MNITVILLQKKYFIPFSAKLLPELQHYSSFAGRQSNQRADISIFSPAAPGGKVNICPASTGKLRILGKIIADFSF